MPTGGAGSGWSLWKQAGDHWGKKMPIGSEKAATGSGQAQGGQGGWAKKKREDHANKLWKIPSCYQILSILKKNTTREFFGLVVHIWNKLTAFKNMRGLVCQTNLKPTLRRLTCADPSQPPLPEKAPTQKRRDLWKLCRLREGHCLLSPHQIQPGRLGIRKTGTEARIQPTMRTVPHHCSMCLQGTQL